MESECGAVALRPSSSLRMMIYWLAGSRTGCKHFLACTVCVVRSALGMMLAGERSTRQLWNFARNGRDTVVNASPEARGTGQNN